MEPASTPPPPLLDAYAVIRCDVRLQHSLDASISLAETRKRTEAEQRRIDGGLQHEQAVIDELVAANDDLVLINDSERDLAQEATMSALVSGAPLIARGWLPPDREGRRRGRPDLLVKVEDGYLPVEIKLHLLSMEGHGSLESSSLAAPFPSSSQTIEGRRFRKGTAWFDDSLQLAHYYRMLEAFGYAGQADGLLGGVIDGSGTLWWIDLDMVGGRTRTTPLADYDRRFATSLELADRVVARNADNSLPRPLTPWHHKACETCLYSEICEHELQQTDDVSLVRWSSADTLRQLRDAGVHTRSQLAQLDLSLLDLAERLSQMSLSFPAVLSLARAADPTEPMADVVGRRMGVRRHLAQSGIDRAHDLLDRDAITLELAGQVRDLGRLVRRARAHLGGGVLLQVPSDQLNAAAADVEVDIDMESYVHATYLWGAFVTNHVGLEGVEEGYRSFATFDELTDGAEAAIFAEFWAWLNQLRTFVRAKGKSFRAYCFWRAAEESQMKRAAEIGGEGVPTGRELDRFFRSTEWVDLHELAKNQLLTEGPLGLKVLASYAGFSWRDEDPSGEASIGWYEEAVGPNPEVAARARARLLAYNEDDVLATRALRRWFEGPARDLPHVDEVLSQHR